MRVRGDAGDGEWRDGVASFCGIDARSLSCGFGPVGRGGRSCRATGKACWFRGHPHAYSSLHHLFLFTILTLDVNSSGIHLSLVLSYSSLRQMLS